MKNNNLVCALLAGSLVFGASVLSYAGTVEGNREQLLKTRSCPSCNLAGVNLNRAELAGADLQGADLTNARFLLANLAGANLQKARLRGARFGGADLAGADLRGADIEVSALNGAYYEGAAFDPAIAAALGQGGKASAGPAKDAVETGQPATPADPPAAVKTKAEPVPAPKTEPVPAPVTREAVEPSHQDFADSAAAATGTAPMAPVREEAIAKEPEASGAARPVVEETAGGDDQAVPLPAAEAAGGEAPPVKTAASMGAIEIDASPPEPEVPASTEAPRQEEAIVEEQQGKVVEPVAQVELTGVAAADTAVVQEETAAQPAAAEDTPAVPADKEKLDRLATLLNTKRCFGCDLSGLDLSDMRLGKADLEGADLSDCNLAGADLAGANLKGAKLRRAKLNKAGMKAADLYRADLTGADLTDADMDKALTDDAVFTDAIGRSEATKKD